VQLARDECVETNVLNMTVSRVSHRWRGGFVFAQNVAGGK
jgi:hypothetical protein